MSDRPLLLGALVPMASGFAGLLLLQRAPAFHEPSPIPRSAVAVGAKAPDAKMEPPVKPWVGVVIARYTAELAADTSGRLAGIFVATGAHVATGDKILQFDQGEIAGALGVARAELGQRESDLARARARLDASRAKLQRLRAGEAWLSQQEVDTAQSEARVAEAELSAAHAAVDMGRAQVSQQRLRAARHVMVAPFTGTVIASDLGPGDSVAAGQVLARVVSDDRQVRFALSPTDLVAGRTEVTIVFPGSGERVAASVDAYRPEVDPSAHLVFATATPVGALTSGPNWIPGTPVDVFPSAAAPATGAP